MNALSYSRLISLVVRLDYLILESKEIKNSDALITAEVLEMLANYITMVAEKSKSSNFNRLETTFINPTIHKIDLFKKINELYNAVGVNPFAYNADNTLFLYDFFMPLMSNQNKNYLTTNAKKTEIFVL